MRMCIVGKYPPIQGGVSAHTLWTAHCLTLSGHEVHLVTNAPEVEDTFRLQEELYADQPGLDPRLSVPVHVHSTLGQASSGLSAPRYIPYANPYVSKLAGRAARVAADTGCDLLYAFYLEPYGVAAQLASAWTGVPYGLRHAGSDISGLYKHAGLGETYASIARNASFWISGNDRVKRGLRHLGVPGDRLFTVPFHSLNTDYFKLGVDPMRLDEVGEHISDGQHGFHKYHPYFGVRQRSGRPTIGVYGKMGKSKGTFDLLRAFAKAKAVSGDCNLVLATGGTPYELDRLYQAASELGLSDKVSLIPFMPPWKIPGLISACDAVAFLERDFPVQIHHPTVPREVLACGSCLILSREVAEYQEYASLLRDSENCLIADPRDTDELAAALSLVIDDPLRAREIGRAGHAQISRRIENWPGYIQAVSGTFESIQADMGERRIEMTVADMQAALARISADEAYRSWFELAPEAALDKYSLTESERSALKSIDTKLMGIFAASLKSKREHWITKAFPLCRQVCGEQLARYFGRFYDLHPAEPGVDWAAQVASFGRFLADCLAVDPSVAPYAVDLCRYELAAFEVDQAVLPSDDLRTLDADGATALDDRPIDPAARPMLLPGVRVVSFDYDVPSILLHLSAEDALEHAPERRAVSIIMRVGRSGALEVFEVNAATAALLRVCSGALTLAEIERRMSGQIGVGDTPARALRQMLRQFLKMNLINVASAPPGGAGG